MPRQPAPAEPMRTETLYAIIGAIADGPDLDRVLPAVVDLLVDATACHACFVYLREGDQLRIRAASPVFAHVVGKVAFGIDEGLAGWVARNRTPAFIPEAALDDPRIKYVPELEEERFQSMVAVPLVDRRGDVIGVVVLHTEAPREFDQAVLDLLVHVASLVVGAIDNARLFEQTQAQVATLSALSELAQQLASLTRRDDLYAAGRQGISELLRADHCSLALYDADGVAAEVAATDAPPVDSPSHAAAGHRLTARLLEGDRAFGFVRVARATPFSADDERLLETAANQLALALRTAEMIERLTAENRVRQVFDAFEHGRTDVAAGHARAAGWPADRHYSAIVALPSPAEEPRWERELGEEIERRLRQAAAGALVDLGADRLRALVPAGGTAVVPLAAMGAELGVSLGVSAERSSLDDGGAALREAGDAARIALALHGDSGGGARAYSDLGPYRFLVAMIDAAPPDTEHARILTALADYDHRHRGALLETLEAYLAQRGVVRATAEQLIIHPNTLRQRLDRIEELAGLRLGEQDLLSLELSLKLHRLRG